MATSNVRLKGLESISIGDCGADGIMGTSLVEIGHIKEETASLEFALPDVTSIYDEGEVDPDMVLVGKNGQKTLKFSTRDVQNANMILAFGGSENVDSGWDAPTETYIKEQSVEIKSKVINGTRRVYNIPRALIRASFNGLFTEKDPGTIDFEIIVLTPRDASDLPLRPVYVNPENISGKVADPIITQSAVNKFTIACGTSGATIYYSITGLDPSGDYGTEYSAEVTITEDVMVRAIATKDGSDNSNIVSKVITYSAP